MNTEDPLEIKALGRSCLLGQLYDAKIGIFLPGQFLFSDETAKSVNKRHSEVAYREVKSFSDRASSLGIGADVSVSILCGSIELAGSGSFLASKEDTSESITVAAIAQYRTSHRILDLNRVRHKMEMDPEIVRKTRATHVVTSIVYGANVIGTLTRSSARARGVTVGKGDLTLGVFKKFSKLAFPTGEIEMSGADRERINEEHLHVSLSADISLADQDKVPLDPASVIELIEKSARLVGDGVPCEVGLTPLSMIDIDAPAYRELGMADLQEIQAVYDQILKLENSRVWLRNSAEIKVDLFPSFVHKLKDRSREVVRLAQEARQSLREYLRRFRDPSQEISQAAAPFARDISGRFLVAAKEYEKDRDEWYLLLDRSAIAEKYGFTPSTPEMLRKLTMEVEENGLNVVLVPEHVGWKDLADLYKDFSKDVRDWSTSVKEVSDVIGGSPSSLDGRCVSIFIDHSHDSTLTALDSSGGGLRAAIGMARESKKAIIVMYTRQRGNTGGSLWRVLGQEGWGIVVNNKENWRFIGELQAGRPHGNGMMTYADQTRYMGSFVHGKRDGIGRLFSQDGAPQTSWNSIFIRNAYCADGVLVKVTVHSLENIPIQHREIALSRSDSIRSHVDRIGTLMEWQLQDKFRVRHRASRVDTVGSMIDGEESPSVEVGYWELSPGDEILVHVR